MSFFYATLAVLLCLTALPSTRYVKRALARSKIIRERGCQYPPSLPQKDPIFGIDLIYSRIFQGHKIRSRNRHLRGLFDTFGHTFLSRPYGRNEYYTISPANIQAIYATDFESFGVAPIRHFIFGPLIGSGIMTTDGSSWKHSRTIVAPTFTKAQNADLSTFDVHVTRLLDIVPKDGSSVDLQPLFERLALDSTTELLFGKSVGSLAPNPPADAQEFLYAYNYAQQGFGTRMLFPFSNFFTLDKKFWESCKVAHRFVDEIVHRTIQQHASSRSQEDQNNNLAYVLAQKACDPKEMPQQLLNVFLPAHDAISIPLTNIFFNLARNPRVWSKLRQEVLDMGSAELTAKRLKELTYLHFVISETFRLYPGVCTNERIALRDTVLPKGGGSSGDSPILIKEGDLVTISFHTLQRQEDIWGEDAEEFRPERWETIKPSPWENLPFGAGPRVCPGLQLGMTQVAYTIVRMVREFKTILNRDTVEEFEDLYRMVTVSKNGAKVTLVPY